ncbi:MAG: hypothetical protein HWD59_02990 [Coxiellaceae bacterium]|nr:MAG: hypothetical protein HWD59_02990 [Coxiellaceae bacterium]
MKNKVELWEEGNKLEHCSSTYAVKCFKQPYFVLSERNNLGEPISTFEVFLTNDPTKKKTKEP